MQLFLKVLELILPAGALALERWTTMPDEQGNNEMNDQSTNLPEDGDEGGMLSGKKTQMAMGAAATLGLLLLYKLRQKMQTTEDPEGYASVQRVKEALRIAQADERRAARRKSNSLGGRRTGNRREHDRDAPGGPGVPDDAAT